ncbi:hypothetical protein BD626DRAFT_575445 [Schizophyllum amplum]|uniref:Uncharacterized protein n=1 Tax=Schizophyllum amplum TaxID=97359 RepID=A0A550BVU7_9AGAR|nr:hypothetical protein BD626DRAFT_575445 [Auriculariopsis ampla]
MPIDPKHKQTAEVARNVAQPFARVIHDLRSALSDHPHDTVLAGNLLDEIIEAVNNITSTRIDPPSIVKFGDHLKEINDLMLERLIQHDATSPSQWSLNIVFVAKMKLNTSRMKKVLAQMNALLDVWLNNAVDPCVQDAIEMIGQYAEEAKESQEKAKAKERHRE